MNKFEMYDDKKVNVERVSIIERWFKGHKTLPEQIENILLHQFLYSVYGDVEKAKNLIELQYNLRFKNPKYFQSRDPNELGVQAALKQSYMIVLPTIIEDNYNISIFKLKDNDAEKFNMENYMKAFTLFIDVIPKYIFNQTPLKAQVDNVIVFDVSTITLKHLIRIQLSALRVYMKFAQEAVPNRIKQIHVINVSPISKKIISMSRPFMNEEVKKMLHVHPIGSETLYDFIPQSIMPTEYGGMAGKLDDFQKQVLLKIQENRDYLMDDRNWQSRCSNGAKK